MAEWLLLAGAGTGLGLLALAGRLLLIGRNPDKEAAETQTESAHEPWASTTRSERRTLAEVSRIWTGRGQVVEFREIARLWREPNTQAPKEPVPDFHHPEIAAFHRERVAGRSLVKGAKKRVIEQILLLLDAQGECPSVVRRHKDEAEGKFDPDVFALLAQVSLREHALAVARTLARRLDQPVLLPDVLIIGLGHDLGKIPAYQGALYRSGDHPLISLIVLEQIPEYAALRGKDELSEAIRQHHLLKPESPLGRDLKKADQQVRREEIGRLTRPLAKETQDAPATKKSDAQAPRPQAPDQTAPARPDQAPPSWFDAQGFLEALKERVNKLENGRWSVVSSPDGYVYAQPDALWSLLRAQAGEDPVVLVAHADEDARRMLLLSVVTELERRKAVAGELLIAGHYAARVTVAMDSGKSFEAMLVPFRVEAFGTTPSMLEATKISRLRKMVQTITPGRKSEEQCASSL
ncbi:HD domain-containing protein [Geoalkalibacter halelectricus]|uniref:HD domain-containing protein n=1 Tax=Geoalkalibacter halelectricus TaxID=2847045 RepID=UPI00266F90D7|nr:HD domain-containing protein [Geoalkalibacter halelectricus]MDO3380511.1 hypothetical protein [Geoalkalibacter halelectricus]